MCVFFFFNDTATTEIYTLSLHDALPIFKLTSKVALDYESLRKNYTLEVQASSQHMITKATVIVKLQDTNDNKPELKNFTIVVNNYRYINKSLFH